MSDAADKLAKTRSAIIDQIYRKEGRRDGASSARRERERQAGGEQAWEQPEPGSGVRGWFAYFKHTAGAWWRHHPAHMGVELATPILSAYAARKPAQFLGIAAAVGAVVVIARPWRLISVTGLTVAIVKSSQLSNLVMSAMSAADFQKDHNRGR